MREMWRDAGANSEKVAAINKRQLVGIEFQNEIYALAVSNMVVHGDGKTNIIPGDCFTQASIVGEKWKPTVGLLNPPYSTAISEMDFVLNNLEALQPNGKCVAIIPINCVIGDDKITLDRKRRLLEQHTLEAVLSMPVSLFLGQQAGVATSIIVVTAHKPHPANKKTWFGYCHNDGFVVKKHVGRVDAENKWAGTKDRWLSAFRNRDAIPMLSVTKAVSYKDEWCAEAYMEPDWSCLTREAVERTFKEFAIHSLLMEDQNVLPE